jgi:hypothetical protein
MKEEVPGNPDNSSTELEQARLAVEAGSERLEILAQPVRRWIGEMLEHQGQLQHGTKEIAQIAGKFPTFKERDGLSRFGDVIDQFEGDFKNANESIEPWLEELREQLGRVVAYHDASLKEAGLK